jgi:hypothetical protein
MMTARNADSGTRHRAMQVFFHRWKQLANRFPVRWEKKIESGITPPNSRDGASIVS